MSNLGEQLQQAKEDITYARTYGPLMRALLVESIRDEFRTKSKAPGTNPFKRLGYKVAAAATYLVG